MADKAISELTEATQVTPTDMFVLEQNGTAKKLTGQTLENWLLSFADGHGGIQTIEKTKTSGLVDTYTITLSDTTKITFTVTNGKGISSISKTSTKDLVDTYKITYTDGTSDTYTVTNGEKGDTGDAAYIWIKYASQEPTESSHSIGDVPDNWIGIYAGTSSTAPTDWEQYKWFKIKGEKGDKGDPATLVSSEVVYQVSDSGTIIPSGDWGDSVPVVAQGKYLWTRTTSQFNTGDPIVAYSVARMGKDGAGSVSSVCNKSPDSDGNVALGATDVGALSSAGGDMTGAINMNGQKITGLNDPTQSTEAARKAYVDKMLPKSGGTMTGNIAMGGKKVTGLGKPTDSGDAVPKSYAANKRNVSSTSMGKITVGGTHTLKESIIGKEPVFALLEYTPAMGRVGGASGNRTILFSCIANATSQGVYINLASFNVSDDGLTLTLGFIKKLQITNSGIQKVDTDSFNFGSVVLINT